MLKRHSGYMYSILSFCTVWNSFLMGDKFFVLNNFTFQWNMLYHSGEPSINIDKYSVKDLYIQSGPISFYVSKNFGPSYPWMSRNTLLSNILRDQ